MRIEKIVFLPIILKNVETFSEAGVLYLPKTNRPTIMKNRLYGVILLLLMLLIVALFTLRKSEQERLRHASNVAALVVENQTLRGRLTEGAHSLPRLRLTAGELSDYRPTLASKIAKLEFSLRRVESVTHLATEQHIDTLITAPIPILTDSLCRLRWQDSWTRLSVDMHKENAQIAFTTCDTLLQVVHRVPYRWWIFSFGTKAIRQEIRSSNPHTHLTYAEYIELE